MKLLFRALIPILLLLLACASKKNATLKTDCEIGKPIPDCICTMEYDPVCGCNKVTYSNACAAECAGVPIEYEGECN